MNSFISTYFQTTIQTTLLGVPLSQLCFNKKINQYLIGLVTMKQHVGNFQLCQKLLKAFEQRGTDISLGELHKFIGRVDRTTLRMECYFTPYQNLMAAFSQKIINDKYLCSKPFLVSRTFSVFHFLNFYHEKWFDRSTNIVNSWFQEKLQLDNELLLSVYRSCIDLGWYNNTSFLTRIRKIIITNLISEVVNFNADDLAKFTQKMHKNLRIILLDKSLQLNEVDPLMKQLQKLLEKNIKLVMSSEYNYVHSAKICEYLKVFNYNLPDSRYKQFLNKTYQRYKEDFGKGQNDIDNTSKNFECRGQSVFQIRFQRRLVNEGYWFQRNKIIGIHQYDILLKGTLQREYSPFQRLGPTLDLQKVDVVSEKELNTFDKSPNIWKIQDKQQWSNPLLLNLNGPYHRIYGDKQGIMRSQQIKRQIAHFYGYKNFKVIDFRDWQQKTVFQRETQQYIKNLVHQR